jgi:hypothetical protein
MKIFDPVTVRTIAARRRRRLQQPQVGPGTPSVSAIAPVQVPAIILGR